MLKAAAAGEFEGWIESKSWTKSVRGPRTAGEPAEGPYFDCNPNPCCAIRTISRPMGSDAVAAGDTTFHTCSMFCEHTNWKSSTSDPSRATEVARTPETSA